jgi:hypothetical protein
MIWEGACRQGHRSVSFSPIWQYKPPGVNVCASNGFVRVGRQIPWLETADSADHAPDFGGRRSSECGQPARSGVTSHHPFRQIPNKHHRPRPKRNTRQARERFLPAIMALCDLSVLLLKEKQKSHQTGVRSLASSSLTDDSTFVPHPGPPFFNRRTWRSQRRMMNSPGSGFHIVNPLVVARP